MDEAWAQAAKELLDSSSDFEEANNLSLSVRRYSLLGRIRSAQGDWASAEEALRRAADLWSSPTALDWIRAQTSGEPSQTSIQSAVDAAAAAVFEVAEIRRQQTVMPCPKFQPPRALRSEFLRLQSSPVPREGSETVRQLRKAYLEYTRNEVGPWLSRTRDAINVVEREYEKVYLVAPAVRAYWRIAVAQRIGAMWDVLMSAFRHHDLDPPEPQCPGGVTCYYALLDPADEPYKQYARSAFDTCLKLSRRHRMYTEFTAKCEAWLANHYHAEYHCLDEIAPYAQYSPTNPLRGVEPDILRPQ